LGGERKTKRDFRKEAIEYADRWFINWIEDRCNVFIAYAGYISHIVEVMGEMGFPVGRTPNKELIDCINETTANMEKIHKGLLESVLIEVNQLGIADKVKQADESEKKPSDPSIC
jgi:predicted translin family RNA/ssDNA-binding protein